MEVNDGTSCIDANQITLDAINKELYIIKFQATFYVCIYLGSTPQVVLTSHHYDDEEEEEEEDEEEYSDDEEYTTSDEDDEVGLYSISLHVYLLAVPYTVLNHSFLVKFAHNSSRAHKNKKCVHKRH